MMKIAIIGGIGSGKSTVMDRLEKLSCHCEDCDRIYDEIATRSEYIRILSAYFPSCVEDGKLDRKKLSDIVFSDNRKLAQLNAIAHPFIIKELEARCGDGATFIEASAFYNSGMEKMFDKVIMVYADRAVRTARVKRRSGLSDDKIRSIMENQGSDRELAAYADFVVCNNSSPEALDVQLMKIIKAVGA